MSKLDQLIGDAYARLNRSTGKEVRARACNHCSRRLVGAETATGDCETCLLPICDKCQAFFPECPIANDWNTNSGLPIGPRAKWDRPGADQ